MFVQNFSASQNYLIATTILLTDTSTGSDSNIVSRSVFVQDANGNTLANVGWALANNTISLNILTQDSACVITVQWLDVNNAVLYTSTQTFCFPANNQQFFYYLVQMKGLNPQIPADANYNSNMALFYTYLVGAMSAVAINADIKASQSLLDKATYMQQQQNLFF